MTIPENKGCNLTHLSNILDEISQQPSWRNQADKEADYIDGNQLDNPKLQDQAAKGIAPLVENVISRIINEIRGLEAKNRTDLQAICEGKKENADVIDSINQKLNQAERESGADRAVTQAHKKQIGLGLGWVEVARETNPFKYPYRVSEIHRNDIYWDMKAKEPDLSDAMWMLRRKWVHVDAAVSYFPEQEDDIRAALGTGQSYFEELTWGNDSVGSTGLAQSLDITRGWAIEESEWRDLETQRLCITEVCTKYHRATLVLKMGNGRIVEYDKKDEVHRQAVAVGYPLVKCNLSDIYKTFFLGPIKLHEEKIKSDKGRYPYIPFFGEREDRTDIPYGIARSMMSQQDELNSRNSALLWGLGAVRTTRTEDAVAMPDEVFRQTIARRDSDIILSKKEMQTGGVFEVKRDFEANEQQFKRLADIREAMDSISGVSKAYQGREGANRSAEGLSLQIEQSNQGLATISDNLKFARKMMGDALVSFIIEDIQDNEEVLLEGSILKGNRRVVLNETRVDDITGRTYKNNDVQRVKINMALADVPSTPSYRQQALAGLTEFAKSCSPAIQQALAPHIASLAEIPDRMDVVEMVREASKMPSEEEIEKDKQEAIEQALLKAQIEIKQAELDIKREELNLKQDLTSAQIEKLVNEAVDVAIKSQYSALQTAGIITQTPATAPLADQLLRSGGYVDKDQAPIVPEFPGVYAPPAATPAQVQELPTNTDPITPSTIPSPSTPGVGGSTGIETQRMNDNV